LKRVSTFLAITFLAVMTSVRCSGAIDAVVAAGYFKEVEQLSRSDGGRLWGVQLGGPVFFVDPVTQEVVANQADKEGKLVRHGDVWVGKLPDNLAPANSAVDWAGVRWTMVMWPLPEMEHSRGRLLMHECFHRIQDRIGLPGSNPNNGHLDDKEGRIWMRLEMRALAESLSRSGKERLEAIEDALAFRARREAFCGIQTAASERELEMNEGLAEYTGLVLSGFGKPSWETRAAVRLEQEQANTTFARSFAYATGPAYGLLLDSFRVPWRKGLKPTTSLPSLLGSTVRAKPPSDVLARAARYGGSRVIAFEEEQANRRAQKVAAFRKAYVDGPTLTLPVASQFSFSFDPNGVDSFPGVGQVFGSAKVSDEWGILQVQSGGVLMKRPESKFTGVVLPAPANTEGGKIAGEGWTLQLNAGWKLAPGARSGDWIVVHE
jgi:hypothetical protein